MLEQVRCKISNFFRVLNLIAELTKGLNMPKFSQFQFEKCLLNQHQIKSKELIEIELEVDNQNQDLQFGQLNRLRYSNHPTQV